MNEELDNKIDEAPPQVSVIIDNGSSTIKAGFSGEDIPRAIFRSAVNKPKQNRMIDMMQKEKYVGGDDNNANAVIENGIIKSWDNMEKLWHHTFYNELLVAPEECNVFLIDSPFISKIALEKMTQILMETFNVEKMYIGTSSILSLNATGRITGVVIDTGNEISHTVAIEEGQIINNTLLRLDLAGKDITNYLIKILTNQGYLFNTFTDKEIVRDIKEKLMYISENYEIELKNFNLDKSNIEKNYELPDGKIITIGEERFLCPEILFKPHLIEKENGGIHALAYQSIIRSDVNIREDLYTNLVLSGGNSMFPGIAERLTKEMADLAPDSTKIKVIVPPQRKYLSWIGGSILTGLTSFENLWLSKYEYESSGPSIIHRKGHT